ncbi:energy-coupling factor transporter transmembrane protein EcfT [Martelella sp. HB161492]|uniref:energy-coupling factor transporter transmembrane component T family protein n=1 Tax=Martelella sp. HB161492 TaxID=2720726 RepID=UPI001590C232|nr:energy-coupling factor transporter transmembrane protein EcfT [Martelella sp. HB161492]
MQTLFVDGNTIFHRFSPGVKIAGLVAFSVALFASTSPAALAALLLLALISYAILPLGLKASIARLLPIVGAILLVGIVNLIFSGPVPTAVMVSQLTALMLFGATVTATTTIADFIDVITRWARPLERIGLVNAADIGLSVGLVIRFVPEILTRYGAIRDAHRARGLAPKTGSVIIPLLILTLKDADQVAAAIDARGIRRPQKRRKTE